MAAIPFSFAYQDGIPGQPLSNSKIYAYSTGLDTQNLQLQDETYANQETLALDSYLEVLSTNDYSNLRWAILSAPAAGTVHVFSADEGIAAIGDIRVDSIPVENDTLSVGFVGAYTTVYTFKAAPASPNEIQIGSDLEDQANEIFLTMTGADGRSVQNPYVDSSLQGTVVTITDRIPCSRYLAWAVQETASNFSIRQPIGGSAGSLLAQFQPGETEKFQGSIELDTEDGSAPVATLPPGKTGVTDSISIGGSRLTLDSRLWEVGPTITCKYEVSNDGENWKDGESAIPNPDDTFRYVTPVEHIQFIRLNILSNDAVAGSPLNFKVIT